MYGEGDGKRLKGDTHKNECSGRRIRTSTTSQTTTRMQHSSSERRGRNERASGREREVIRCNAAVRSIDIG